MLTLTKRSGKRMFRCRGVPWIFAMAFLLFGVLAGGVWAQDQTMSDDVTSMADEDAIAPETVEPSMETATEPPVILHPATNLHAMDVPNDDGGTISVSWEPPEGDTRPDYYILEIAGLDGIWNIVTRTVLLDYQVGALPNFVPFKFRVKTFYGDKFAVSDNTPEVEARDHWLKLGKIPVFISIFLYIAILVAFLQAARRGVELFVRRISGLTAVENAIGRATEMGRPVLYVPGTSSIEDVATLASLNILGEVARRTVHYDVKIICPNRDPIVYTVAREIVKETYAAEGRPDAFDPDSVFFMVPDQFAYAAGVDGIMVRQRPATIFFMGMFWAESLIMAETGASTGAVQIAGTDSLSQLPFFITSCDYTLIGEELYAASAYLSREPLLLGTLKSQDYGKLVFMVLMVLLTLLNLIFGLDVISWIQVR